MTPSADLVGLADCPFCGNESHVILRQDGMNHAVVCNAGSGGCGSRGPYKAGEFDAITAWNTRAPTDELHALGGGWISVEDRLPEFTNWNETSSGEVAILNDRDEVMSAEWAFNSYAASERGRLPRWERGGRIYQGVVTHWQPLPPSPAATVEG